MPSPAPPPAALRLTFAFDGDTIRHVGTERLVKTVPPSHPVADYMGSGGSWFELRDAQGKPIYGRRLHQLIPTHREFFNEDGSAGWRPVQNTAGSFDILVPDLATGASVAVMGVPPSSAAAPAAARPASVELANLALPGMLPGAAI